MKDLKEFGLCCFFVAFAFIFIVIVLETWQNNHGRDAQWNRIEAKLDALLKGDTVP